MKNNMKNNMLLVDVLNANYDINKYLLERFNKNFKKLIILENDNEKDELHLIIDKKNNIYYKKETLLRCALVTNQNFLSESLKEILFDKLYNTLEIKMKELSETEDLDSFLFDDLYYLIKFSEWKLEFIEHKYEPEPNHIFQIFCYCDLYIVKN